MRLSGHRAPGGASRLYGLAIGFGRQVDFFIEIVRGLLRVRMYRGEVVRQASLLVTGSLVVILGLTFSLGLVVGVESVYGGRLIGAPSASGAFTSIAGLREIIPYAFGYMMAAKVSTGYVAEIGTMKITEEIDALDVMAMDSPLYLCTTRLLASWLILPFVYAIAVVVAFIGSFLVVVVQIGEVSAGGYLELFWKFQNPADYLFGLTKAMAMATFVVLVGCYYGFKVRGGPVQVGRATATAMVVNLIGVHVIGILGSELFWGGDNAGLPIGG
jgi:phospholipid/cholesterol/gamma-HCH transport system permease protein